MAPRDRSHVVLARRAFLRLGMLSTLALGPAPPFRSWVAEAASGGTSSRDRGALLITVFLRGGADGLAVVPPFGEREYHAARENIAIRTPARGAPGTAIDLDGFFGFHPALTPLQPLWDAEALAVVHACGSPNPTRSHFDAQDDIETGTPGLKGRSGWLGRLLAEIPMDRPSSLPAVGLGPRFPRALGGAAGAVGIGRFRDFDLRVPSDAGALDPYRAFEALYEEAAGGLLHGTGRQMFEAVRVVRAAVPAAGAARNGAEYPPGRFGDDLRQVAQLIHADVGLKVACVDMGGWDTHVMQGGGQGRIAERLSELARGLAAFTRDLGERMNEVVVLTVTEFGRTVRENSGGGTDHGRASAMLVLGGRVRGGRVYGRWPGLAREQLFEGRDLAVTTDFRDVFAEAAVRHLGMVPSIPLFAGFTISPARFPGVLT